MQTIAQHKGLSGGVKRTAKSSAGTSTPLAPDSLPQSTAGATSSDDYNDNLRPSRGIVFGVIGGIAIWALFILTVFAR